MANLFTYYQQEENRFTNGLLSILELARLEDKTFVPDFFRELLELEISHNFLNFKVLKDIEGTADGEISNEDACLLIETKISSGTLRKEQIKSHLKHLRRKEQQVKNLILLTPDDSQSNYVKQFNRISPSIIHLEWKKVYDFLAKYAEEKPNLLSQIIYQYLAVIYNRIFDQDIVAVIVKIDFGDGSEVYADEYLGEMKRGEWDNWHTPRKYKHLDGKGRKLILYDRTRKALTVEVEIQEVKKTKRAGDNYPWSNKFVPGTLRVYMNPIVVENIRKIAGLENFGVHRKDRNAYRNITYEQYRVLFSL